MTSGVVAVSPKQTRDAAASLVVQAPPRQPDSHHRLSAAAVLLECVLNDPEDILPIWRTRGFERLVEQVRTHLLPIRSHAALAESYRREASRHDPLDTAYALRWLELATGVSRPSWSGLVGGRAVDASDRDARDAPAGLRSAPVAQ